MDYKHLITTRPKMSRCHRCKRRVVDGIEGGLPYRIDGFPLNLLGETMASLSGQRSYWIGMDGFVATRTRWDIEADSHRGRPMVLAAHTCAPVVLAHLETVRSLAAAAWLTKIAAKSEDSARFHDAVMTLAGITKDIISDDEPPF